MVGVVILTIICVAAVLFLVYFFIALWKDGKPHVKCRYSEFVPTQTFLCEGLGGRRNRSRCCK